MIIERFFSHLSSGDVKTATEELFQTNPWVKKKEDQNAQFVSKLIGITQMVGNYRGYERISEQKVGEKLIGYAYLAHYERQPVRFTFVFYKSNDEWFIYDTSFNSDMDNILKESLKASITK